MDDEPLLNLRPVGQFQTLIWERHMNKCLVNEIKDQREVNKQLKIKNDGLVAEIKKLKFMYGNDTKGQLILSNQKLKGSIRSSEVKTKTYKARILYLEQQVLYAQMKSLK